MPSLSPATSGSLALSPATSAGATLSVASGGTASLVAGVIDTVVTVTTPLVPRPGLLPHVGLFPSAQSETGFLPATSATGTLSAA